MGSIIEQHRPLQSIYIILHLEQTAEPGFPKLQENTKHGLHLRSFYSTTLAESYIMKEPSQTNEANMPEFAKQTRKRSTQNMSRKSHVL